METFSEYGMQHFLLPDRVLDDATDICVCTFATK